MTLRGKCDTCRTRKVKCDERRPVCSACEKKNRPCHYPDEKAPIPVNNAIGEQLVSICVGQEHTSEASGAEPPKPLCSDEREKEDGTDLELLRLKYVRKTEDSNGLYLTFGPQRNSGKKSRCKSKLPLRTTSPINTMLCQHDKIVARWGSIFGYESMDLNPLGEWLRLAWPAIGDDIALRHACEFALSSMELFRHRTDKALNRAYSAGEKAIESLQIAVRACSGPERGGNLILAIFLHSAAEHFIHLGSFNYVAHFLGAGKLLTMYRAEDGSDELVTMIARSTFIDEMMEAVIAGRESSIFENVCQMPMDIHSGEAYDVDVATHAVQYMLAQLPRLVYDGRNAMQAGNEAGPINGLVERVTALFNHDANIYVERTIRATSKIVRQESHSEQDRTPALDAHMEFRDYRSHHLTLGYYFSQMILCGLMQRLGDMHIGGTTTPCLDIVAARARDVAAAKSIAMCVKYSLKPTPCMPFTALAALAPLQLSIGTWIRLQKRQSRSSTPAYVEAAKMMGFALENAEHVVDMWQSAPTTIERMAVCCDMFAGGPYIPKRGLSS